MPGDKESDYERVSPSAFVVLRSRDVLAFLDILPMTGGMLSFSFSSLGGERESREVDVWTVIGVNGGMCVEDHED